jgi:hypothetical protein
MPVFEKLSSRLKNCNGVLVDSNVLLDIAADDQSWSEWSQNALAECGQLTNIIINQIVYAEVSVKFSTIAEVDTVLPAALYVREELPWEAGFLAGKCYAYYRRKGGIKTSPMPDFYIGAHAAIRNLALLTRDAARYQSYFPKLEILAPRHKS